MKRCIVIMAGGTGTRLWPLSRKNKPKQFHSLLSQETLLQETYQRAQEIVEKDSIYVSTTKEYADLVQKDIPDIAENRIIIEPGARSTCPAIALSALMITREQGNVLVATIASDHAIGNVREFSDAIQTAFEAIEAHQDSIATIGISPTHPSTAFGYIKIGHELNETFPKRVFYADAFKEKPKIATAKKYLSGWEYLWNAGYFIFTTDTLLELTRLHAPEISKKLSAITKELDRERPSKRVVEKHYLSMPEEAIDTAIIEKLHKDRRLVVPTDLEWDDIGNWEALYTFLQNKYDSSIIAKGNHIDLGSEGCFISGKEKLIATLNLKNIVVIESDDAILVANRKDVDADIKKLIKKLKDEGKCPYL